ncbi:MAG TPA: M20/M25/M40 family metallo-hydrolase [Chthoniobacterales bacterium]|jgi:carboxypeptidase Q|nr:M20/M25/M40 family metallo-hydrolase [Chthoniobacterales bacterium]
MPSRKFIFCIGFLLTALSALAQNQSPAEGSTSEETPTPTPTATPNVFSPQTLANLKRIQQAALSSDYAYRQVAHLSNNIGPRLTGSAQAAKAVEYVAGELKAIGCEVQLEKVMVPHWVRGEETAALVSWPGMAEGTAQKILLCALGESVATPKDGITADVVTVKNFEELKAMPRDKVAGKIVLFNYPFDKQMAAQGHAGPAYGEAVEYRSDGPSAAARQGAVACLIRSVGGADYRLPHTGQTKYADDAPKIPAGAVTAEDAQLIVDLAKQGPVKMKLLLTPQTLPNVESANVIGDFKGSQHPEQVVIVSGHLDSWDLGTGAIDDGAGVAVSMEVANLLHKLNLKPKRTIRVIAWMNEENGLAGAKQYAKDHAKDWANHFASIETDGGADHPVGLHIKAKPEVKAMLKAVAAILQESGAGALELSESAGADIGPIEKAGVPGFAPIQDGRFYFNYHHTAADTLDKINPKFLAENSAVVAVAAYALANSEQPLPR